MPFVHLYLGRRGRRLPVAIVLRFDRVGRREPSSASSNFRVHSSFFVNLIFFVYISFDKSTAERFRTIPYILSIRVFQIRTGEVVQEYVNIRKSCLRHSFCAVLAHSDSVTPARSVEHKARILRTAVLGNIILFLIYSVRGKKRLCFKRCTPCGGEHYNLIHLFGRDVVAVTDLNGRNILSPLSMLRFLHYIPCCA